MARAVATLRESTPAAISIAARAVQAVMVGAVSPGPSAPTTIAQRVWVVPALIVGVAVLILLALAYMQWNLLNG